MPSGPTPLLTGPLVAASKARWSRRRPTCSRSGRLLGECIQGERTALRQAVSPNGAGRSSAVSLAVMRHSGGKVSTLLILYGCRTGRHGSLRAGRIIGFGYSRRGGAIRKGEGSFRPSPVNGSISSSEAWRGSHPRGQDGAV